MVLKILSFSKYQIKDLKKVYLKLSKVRILIN